MSWENVPENFDKYLGFIYVITNKINNKKYIGQKKYWRDDKQRKKIRSFTAGEQAHLDKLTHQLTILVTFRKSEKKRKSDKEKKLELKIKEFKKKIQEKNRNCKIRTHTKVESDWRDYFGSSEALLEDIEKLGKENFTRRIIANCYTKSGLNYLETKLQFEAEVLFSKEYYNNMINCKINGNTLKKDRL